MALPEPCPTASFPGLNETTTCLPDAVWVKAYLTSHSMSLESRYYGYLFWAAVAFTTSILTLSHLFSLRGGPLGAYWDALILRRRRLPPGISWTYDRLLCRRSKIPPPVFLPSNGRLLGMFTLTSIVLALAFVGPDYLPPGSNPRPGQPTVMIHKAWWTSAARAGIMSFALLPLCILFALKGSPFAILSFKHILDMYFDKLAWLHRWTAVLVWVLSCGHVGLWTVQLMIDRHPVSGDMVFTYVWKYRPFIFGWTAFFFLTFIMVLSLKPFRNAHYELFYALHVLLVPLMLITVALHHPRMWLWAWCSLAVWVGERLWRTARYLCVNHIPSGHGSRRRHLSRRSSFSGYIPLLSNPGFTRHKSHTWYHPPPGFAHAEIVAGTTVRVTYMPPRRLTWAAGQHFLINVPSISRFTTHPFTSASVCKNSSLSDVLVFFIRVKSGWTRDLWNKVLDLCSRGLVSPPKEVLPQDTDLPESGVILRMNIDGPFGSSRRVRWELYSSALIVVGGSGVSFGLSVLEHLCRCIAQGERRARGDHWISVKNRLSRVRFVWIVREYGHIQWAASVLRRCVSMVAASELEINIFVTSFQQRTGPTTEFKSEPFQVNEEILAPPSPYFSRRDISGGSVSSDDGRGSTDSLCETPGADPQEVDDVGPSNMLVTTDLTSFEGDKDVEVPGEKRLNKCVRKESKARRARSRRRLAKGADISMKTAPGGSESGTHNLGKQTEAGKLHLVSSKPGSRPESDSSISKPSPAVSNRDRRTRGYVPSPLGSTTSLGHDPLPLTPMRSSASDRQTEFDAVSFLSRASCDTLPTSFANSLTESNKTATRSNDDESGVGSTGFQLQMSELELRDVMTMSEYARPGKPKLERIMRDEVRAAEGPVVVACCGPASLNTLVRGCIVSQIDARRAWKESGRGQISFVSEEFDY